MSGEEKGKINNESAEAKEMNVFSQDDSVKEASDWTDWESSAYGALVFGLEKYLGRLKFKHGFKLNVDPREIDCLVIDKQHFNGKSFDNAIAAIFKRHNVVEFKNPFEALNIDTVWKVISYAAQYKSSGKRVDAIPAEEITITILRGIQASAAF